VIVGLDGNDHISGLAGDDLLCGGRGKDVLHAVSQAEFDKDCGSGESGDDDLSGGKGNDRLYGGGHTIRLRGNRGDDLLDGCNRLDFSGAIFPSATGPVTVKLNKGFARGEGYDALRNINYVVGSTFGDNIVGSNYTVTIVNANYSEWLAGGGGDDRVRGLQGPDRILGDAGAGTLLGADGVASNDHLLGDDGIDTCTFDVSDTACDRVESCEK